MSDLHNATTPDEHAAGTSRLERVLARTRALLWATQATQLIIAVGAVAFAAVLATGSGELFLALGGLSAAVGPVAVVAWCRSYWRRRRQVWTWTPLTVGVASLQAIGVAVVLAGNPEIGVIGGACAAALVLMSAVTPTLVATRGIERLPVQVQCRLPLDLRFTVRRNEPVPGFAPGAQWLSSVEAIVTADALVIRVPRGPVTGVQVTVPLDIIDIIDVRVSRPQDSPWILFEDGHAFDVIWQVEIVALRLSTGSTTVIPAFDPQRLAAALRTRVDAMPARSRDRNAS